MKVTLIAPGWQKAVQKAHIQFPPLGLAMVAASTPASDDVEIVDENVEPIDFDAATDLVGISGMTCQAPRAYEIAERYRSRGVPVIMGGHHASLLPEESMRHVDSVVIGEAEEIWPRVLEDVRGGRLERTYQASEMPELSTLPLARRDLLKAKSYSIFNTVQTTRGCPFDCEFCSVTTFFGRVYRTRPVEQVVAEVESVLAASGSRRGWRNRFFFFVDDNIVAKPKYAKDLFRALIPLKISWVSQGTITTFTQDDELLELAAKSGCRTLFIGLETVAEENLKSINKTFNRRRDYEANLAKIHRHGIGVLGSFIFGLEHDDETVFRRTVEFAQANAIDAANFSILTPYPGTRLAKRYARDNKIIERDWSHFHALTEHVLIEHERLSSQQLLGGTAWSWITYYSWRSILRRFLRSPRSVLRNLAIILGYRRRATVLKKAEKASRRGLRPDVAQLLQGA